MMIPYRSARRCTRHAFLCLLITVVVAVILSTSILVPPDPRAAGLVEPRTDASVPGETPLQRNVPKAPAPQRVVAPPYQPSEKPWGAVQLKNCLTRAATIVAVGDSHGRQLIDSFVLRIVPAMYNDKSHKPYRVRAGSTVLAQHFAPLLDVTALESAVDIAHSPPRSVHVLLSRGAWDLVFYATPLHAFYLDVTRALFKAVELPAAATVTLRLPHHFRALQQSTLQPCVHHSTVEAYRATAACAAAHVMRRTKLVQLAVLDPAAAAEGMSYKKDGVHLSSRNAALVADFWASRTVCRDHNSPMRSGAYGALQLYSEPEPIEQTFPCAAVARAFEASPRATVNLSASSAADAPLERLFRVGTRYRCRCMDPITQINDQCGVLHNVMAHPREERAARFASYVCAAREQLLRGALRHGEGTNFSVELLREGRAAARWLGEIVLEVCAAPATALRAFKNAGYRAPDGALDDLDGVPVGLCDRLPAPAGTWCRDRSARLRDTANSVSYIARIVMNSSINNTLPDAIGIAGRCDNWRYLSVLMPLLCSEQWAGLTLQRRRRTLPAAGQSHMVPGRDVLRERLALVRWALRARGATWTATQLDAARRVEQALSHDTAG